MPGRRAAPLGPSRPVQKGVLCTWTAGPGRLPCVAGGSLGPISLGELGGEGEGVGLSKIFLPPGMALGLLVC